MSAFIALALALALAFAEIGSAATLDLAGPWQVSLTDPATAPAWQAISLPGTLDDAKIGTPLTLKPELTLQVLTRLQRRVMHIGPAWYRRTVEIPTAWSGQKIYLELERVIWESRVFVDGREVSRADSLVAPHRHDLTAALTPGSHELLLRIDNREIHPEVSHHATSYKLPEDAPLAHAYTNHTQIIWNGVLGTLRLRTEESVALRTVAVFPRLTPAPGLSVRVDLTAPAAPGAKLHLALRRASDGALVGEHRAAAGADGRIEWTLPASAAAAIAPWDEFSPALYQLTTTLDGRPATATTTTFGFREFAAVGREFRLNGHRIFLRGNLECAIFPLTGQPPTDLAAWKKLLGTAKAWGLNHFRFHSWCPPEAAFAAADELGFYFQVELPNWSLTVGKNADTWAFLQAEGDRIIANYGNHPSFLFFSMGNELQGEMSVLNDEVRRQRARDPRHLYTATTFTFEKGHGRAPEPADDYFITQYTKEGWVRGQGVFNDLPPAFDADYTKASANITVPLVQHEAGQYSVYPDLAEIARYTGNLVPLNFMAVRDDLAKKGLLALAPQFTAASGRFAALLYKEEIERALRTPEFDGFQLLQLQDFPGQGTALVGLLNAFWESKGFISAAEFRQFCGPVVPLARFPKAIYERGEAFTATVELANYFRALPATKVEWTVRREAGAVIARGDFGRIDVKLGGGQACGTVRVPIPAGGSAEHWRLEVAVVGTEYRNGWSFWVYPPKAAPEPSGVRVAKTFEEARAALAAGERVLFNPAVESIAGIRGKFVPVFWSPVHFPKQPGTMGLLCDPAHPALADFPTAAHSDWQWWDLTIRSRSVVLDGLAATPLVRVIDNFNRNHSLAAVFEARVGPGRLLFSAIDLTTDLAKRPAARQLRASLLRYAASEKFAPAGALTQEQLHAIVKAEQPN
ncbi:MAG: glycoside hydrolase family 2 [Undibacterium sp.]|nr:glycoside hydrolase family 2 [Opitutaceae bacterium]